MLDKYILTLSRIHFEFKTNTVCNETRPQCQRWLSFDIEYQFEPNYHIDPRDDWWSTQRLEGTWETYNIDKILVPWGVKTFVISTALKQTKMLGSFQISNI